MRGGFLWALAGVSTVAFHTGFAAPGDAMASTVCDGFEDHLDRFCARVRPSDRTAASCQAVEHSLEALCNGTNIFAVQATAAAKGTALALLGLDLDIREMEEGVGEADRHVVVGPADLRDPVVVNLLRRAYENGRTVAIVDARQKHADTFHRIVLGGLAGASCSAGENGIIPFYGLQKAVLREPQDEAHYCIMNLEPAQAESAREWLRNRFSLQPPHLADADVLDKLEFGSLQDPMSSAFRLAWDILVPPAAAQSSGSTNLTSLTGGTSCQHLSQSGGYEFQGVNDLFSLRDFDNQRDLYNLQQQFIFKSPNADQPYEIISAFNDQTAFTTGVPTLDFSEPQTQTTTGSSYSNSQSTTVTATVGYDASNGPNASVSESVTVGSSQTVSVPPTVIVNESSPSVAVATWLFEPSKGSLPATSAFQPQTQLVWIVPFGIYADPAPGYINYRTTMEAQNPKGFVSAFFDCNANYPFDAFEIEPPVVSSVSPTSQAVGQRFTINGENLYPGLVTGVLLGGDPLDDANVQLVDDTSIKVTIPSTVSEGAQAVQVNANNADNDPVGSNTNVFVTVTD